MGTWLDPLRTSYRYGVRFLFGSWLGSSMCLVELVPSTPRRPNLQQDGVVLVTYIHNIRCQSTAQLCPSGGNTGCKSPGSGGDGGKANC